MHPFIKTDKMGKPAARVGDMHLCPMVTPGIPPIPHVGGPILPPGKPNVLIGGMPAATVTNMCLCVGPPDSIMMGSFTVLIGGLPAARMGDPTIHGGRIAIGFPTVLIGDMGSMGAPALVAIPPPVVAGFADRMPSVMAGPFKQIVALANSAANGTLFCELCNK